jgi:peptidoglycan/LPS O-acetylase OafA/YrhL
MVHASGAPYRPQHARPLQPSRSLPPPAPPKRGFRADVEGLRAVAILAVILYHAGIVSGGFVGVDVFFVISGFLITGLLWREVSTGGRISLSSFYGRRARRLLPAAMVVLVATVAVSAAIVSPLTEREVTKDATAAALYVSNYRFASLSTNYLNSRTTPSPLQHYWSLAVEEQFYLVWPFLILGVAVGWRRLRPRRWLTRPDSSGDGGTSGAAGVSGVKGAAVAALVGLGLVGLTSFILSVHYTAASQPWAFFSLPTRAWEFVAGGLVALAGPQLARIPRDVAGVAGWLGAALVAWSVIGLNGSTPFPGTAALFPVAGTAILLTAGGAAPRRGTSLILSRRPWPAIGRISYAWYLWHWPALTLGEAAAGHPLSLVQKVGLAAGTGWLAFLTVELLENPIRFSPRLVARPSQSLALGMALTVAAAVIAVVTAETLPVLRGGQPAAAVALPASRAADASALSTRLVSGSAGSVSSAPLYDAALEAVSEAVVRATETKNVPSNLNPSLGAAKNSLARPFRDGCDDGYTDPVLRPCIYGDKHSPTTVVLFGDSHAAQWFPAIDELGRAGDWRVVSMTKAVCPPVLLPIWNPVLHRPFRECEQWHTSALNWIAREKPAVVILGVARHYGPEYDFRVYSPQWVSGLAAMVQRIRTMGPQVVVIGPVPHPKGNVPECLSEHLKDAVACTQPLGAAVSPDGIVAEEAGVAAAGGAYVNVIPWVCSADRCAVIIGDILVYRDDNHVTTTWATWLTPVIGATVHPLAGVSRRTVAAGHPN